MVTPKVAKMFMALRHAQRAKSAANEDGCRDVADCDATTPPADFHLAQAVAHLEAAIDHLGVCLGLCDRQENEVGYETQR